jgi:L-fucose isomerase-like protein
MEVGVAVAVGSVTVTAAKTVTAALFTAAPPAGCVTPTVVNDARPAMCAMDANAGLAAEIATHVTTRVRVVAMSARAASS